MGRKKYVVIMAAGSGTRMGAQMPKQFLTLGGKAILQRTIEVFLDADPDISVITVLPEQFIGYWKDYCYQNGFICPQILVKGGFTRFHSVKNALEKVPEGAIVAVHDGVRPLLTTDMVRDLFAKAETMPALIPVMPCIDTMKALQKKVWDDGSESLYPIEGQVVDRSVLYGAQTPQIFHSELLKMLQWWKSMEKAPRTFLARGLISRLQPAKILSLLRLYLQFVTAREIPFSAS